MRGAWVHNRRGVATWDPDAEIPDVTCGLCGEPVRSGDPEVHHVGGDHCHGACVREAGGARRYRIEHPPAPTFLDSIRRREEAA